jgi:hypothetical protein
LVDHLGVAKRALHLVHQPLVDTLDVESVEAAKHLQGFVHFVVTNTNRALRLLGILIIAAFIGHEGKLLYNVLLLFRGHLFLRARGVIFVRLLDVRILVKIFLTIRFIVGVFELFPLFLV